MRHRYKQERETEGESERLTDKDGHFSVSINNSERNKAFYTKRSDEQRSSGTTRHCVCMRVCLCVCYIPMPEKHPKVFNQSLLNVFH